MADAPTPLTDRFRFSQPGLLATRAWKRLRRRLAQHRQPRLQGHCPICDGETGFSRLATSARDGLVCIRCGSVQRQRALASVVVERIGEAALSRATVHAPSPSLCAFDFYRRHVKRLIGSYYWPDRSAKKCGAFHNIDLQDQRFDDETFDLVVTEDVLEHVADPEAAVREIARTLRPAGIHAFTVPFRSGAVTRTRAILRDGRLVHLLKPDYHQDPITRRGALVMTDFGDDLCELIADWGGGECEVVSARFDDQGVPEPVDVFLFTKGVPLARPEPRVGTTAGEPSGAAPGGSTSADRPAPQRTSTRK